jgi:hypothetical protein
MGLQERSHAWFCDSPIEDSSQVAAPAAQQADFLSRELSHIHAVLLPACALQQGSCEWAIEGILAQMSDLPRLALQGPPGNLTQME